jgi:hypothetical protein
MPLYFNLFHSTSTLLKDFLFPGKRHLQKKNEKCIKQILELLSKNFRMKKAMKLPISLHAGAFLGLIVKHCLKLSTAFLKSFFYA